MIDVHLIGYTADLRHLVLDLADGAHGRYRLVVDADLFATVDQLRDERREAGLPVGDPEEYLTAEELAELHGEDTDDHADVAEAEAVDEHAPSPAVRQRPSGMWRRDDVLFGADEDPDDERSGAAEDPDEPQPAPATPATIARVSDAVRLVAPSPFAPQTAPEAADPPAAPAAADRTPDPPAAPAAAPEPPAVEPKLSPAQIQALLRAGRSPRVVAREAGTDVAWIERWLPPILAERTRILDRAQAKRLERPRLGRSRDPLGQAVARNLAAKGVVAEALTWEAARRKDGRWKVSVRFTQRDRPRTATWTYDPSDDELKPASDLAHELGFTRSKQTADDDAAPRRATNATGGRSSR